jgi:23S rRNA (cytosine1962-C5)-methyltransferase
MNVWHLKKGSEKKFRFGHPWVFSNELAQSPKGIPAGALIELRDYQGSFLARGYGHPNSLIAFRTLTTRERSAIDAGFFHERFLQASRLRRIAGISGFSHRLCFAEGDYLPGLVVDRYVLDPSGQVFVVQSSTAGMDQQLPLVFEALELLVNDEHNKDSTLPDWENTSIVLANDSKSRMMENIAVEAKTIIRKAQGFVPEAARLIVQPGLPELKRLIFEADLIGGQKTGFFLDQRFNIQIALRFAKDLAVEKRELRVLDLCCYIGQWGAQLSHLATSLGSHTTVTCVDSSAKALELAQRNVEKHGGAADARKMDVLDAMDKLERRAYDVVICDPPAFIKKKKDIPNGSQAYFKMNREALRRVNGGGLFVSCSCSGLFVEEDFRSMLARASAAYEGEVRWLARGGHSPDHPQRPEFPQGTYLKSWFGIVT